MIDCSGVHVRLRVNIGRLQTVSAVEFLLVLPLFIHPPSQLQFVAKSFVLRREASILSNYLPPKRTRVPHSDKEYANNND